MHTTVIGGIDFSFNVHDQNQLSPHWQPHFQFVIEGCTESQLKDALRRHYPKANSIPKPLKIETVRDDDEVNVFSYLVKPFFERRISYVNHDGQAGTRKISLKPPELREITAFMSRYEITDRLIMQNVRRYGDKLVRKTIGRHSNSSP